MKYIMNLLIIAALAFVMMGCDINERETSTSEKQEQVRDSIMDRANAQVPVPEVQDFVKRRAIAEYMERMDDPNKTFYLYIIADTGNILGYHVSRGGPVNICTFLTPPDRVQWSGGFYHSDSRQSRPSLDSSGVNRKAPGVDGVYYGDAACDSTYFFDAQTDALIEVHGNNLIVSDQPLDLDAEPINVRTESE